MRIIKKKFNNNYDNIFWVTMTDLMTALSMVFIVLFFYTYMTSYYEKIEELAAQEKASQVLEETLESLSIDATVDARTGVVNISDLELFELNSYELSEKGKEYLSKFTPAYLDSLFKNDFLVSHIDKILIMGHTDSQMFKGEYSDDEQYMKNMELSLKRAYAVANYMINTKYNKENGNKLRKVVICEGASYSRPVLVNGKEDYAKSRRVELKILLKDSTPAERALRNELPQLSQEELDELN